MLVVLRSAVALGGLLEVSPPGYLTILIHFWCVHKYPSGCFPRVPPPLAEEEEGRSRMCSPFGNFPRQTGPVARSGDLPPVCGRHPLFLDLRFKEGGVLSTTHPAKEEIFGPQAPCVCTVATLAGYVPLRPGSVRAGFGPDVLIWLLLLFYFSIIFMNFQSCFSW